MVTIIKILLVALLISAFATLLVILLMEFFTHIDEMNHQEMERTDEEQEE